MNIIKKLSYIFDKKQKITIGILAIMIFISGILETLSVSALLPVIAVIMDMDSMLSNRYVIVIMDVLNIKSGTQLIVLCLISMMLLYIFKNLYLLFLMNYQTKFINTSKNRLISRVLREFLNRPYEFYLDADIPTVFRLTDSDIPNVFSMMMAIISLVSEFIVFICLCTLLIISDWKMTVYLVLIFGIVTLLIMKIMKPILNKLGAKNQTIQSRIAKWRIQAIYGIKDVKVLHRESFFADNYEETGKIGARIAKKYSVMNTIPRLLIETVFICSILMYLMIYIVSGKDVTSLLATLMVFGVAAIRLMPCVNRINTYLTEVAYTQSSLNYVYDNLNMDAISKMGVKQEEETSVDNPLKLEDEIILKNMVYCYPNTEKKILDDATMRIPYGKSVGIMGPSGAGKSTVVDVLLGLLKLQSGEILCDGVDVFEQYPAWLAQIGYIPQSIYLVDEPIRNNIAFGMKDEEIDEERVWRVLEEAQIKDFIMELPEKLDTTIGDRGIRLSGGQRQRLGIARALYHNPEILVFDEATSALDHTTEEAVMDAINSFHGKKTMVIIAHRLNTIEKCDIIYKVDAGKITEVKL
ncbi:MAG: ABC transporter ATP-binding protein [Lachnospiraceae bacterium]